MKKTILLLASGFLQITCYLLPISFAAAQTNVSGGIYTNATWTLAGSPYIVVDTVVVFPGVTLTIQPGVVVKFADNTLLEIRQSILVAAGTVTDSITFTSNSASPTPGIWRGVYLNQSAAINIAYCNFRYAVRGVEDVYQSSASTMTLSNSTFSDNTCGIYSGYNWLYINYCNFNHNTYGCSGTYMTLNYCNMLNNNYGVWGEDSVKNSVIDSNTIGVWTGAGAIILNCEIKYNVSGIIDQLWTSIIQQNIITNNDVGIKTSSSTCLISCNEICNNTTWNLYYNVSFGSNINIPHNYWCTTDSAAIDSLIYDGYDNISLGLVHFFPVDTNLCYQTGCNLLLTTYIHNATCDTCHNGFVHLYVSNALPPVTYTWFTSPIQTTQTAMGLASGTYTVCVSDGHGCTACLNVFVDSTNCTGFAVNANAVNATCGLCNDGSATATVTAGTPPYNYTWYTAPIQNTQTATGLPQGTYPVCVTDLYGCVACDTVTVGVGSCSAFFNIFPNPTPHTYDAVNMASGIPPLHYDWSWGDGSPNDTLAFPSHTYATAGFYTICLTITDSVGCTNTHCVSYYLLRATSSMVYVNVISPSALGINTPTDNFISLFPNPVFDHLTLIINENISDAQIKIHNLLGEMEFNSVTSNQKTDIDISSLSRGVYFVEVISGDNVSRKKFIKE